MAKKTWKAWGVFEGDDVRVIKLAREDARRARLLRWGLFKPRQFSVAPVLITLAPKAKQRKKMP